MWGRFTGPAAVAPPKVPVAGPLAWLAVVGWVAYLYNYLYK